jgi:Ribbon-helix-helix protein, copG family
MTVLEREGLVGSRTADLEEAGTPRGRAAGTPRVPTGVRRVNVNFADSTYSVLEELARKRGKTMAEVLRDAIALEKWIDDARSEGGRLLIKQGDETRELVLR